MPLKKAREQMKGTKRNTEQMVSNTGVDDFLPNGIRSLVGEFIHLIPHAAGRGTARQQITSSVILGLLLALTLPFSIPASAGVVLLLFGPLFFALGMGIWRLIPAVNSAWMGSRVRKSVKKDRDVPGWRRE